MERQEAERIIRESPLSTGNTALLDTIKESVRILPEPTDLSALKLGASRFGGLPDLPPGFAWPVWSAQKSGRKLGLFKRKPVQAPLAFLAQINLEDVNEIVADSGLPKQGTFYLFCLEQDEMIAGIVALHAGPCSALVRAQNGCPQPKKHKAHCCALSMKREWTINREIATSPAFEDSVPFDFNQGDKDIFSHIDELQAALSGECSGVNCKHRILGHPDWLQGSEADALEADRRGIDPMPEWDDPMAAELKAAADRWHLLLQIDSDVEHTGWMWGDMGLLYAMIHEEGLQTGNLDQARFLFQSC